MVLLFFILLLSLLYGSQREIGFFARCFFFPILDTTHDREVMLDLPPGGATILCAVRRGMWSSI